MGGEAARHRVERGDAADAALVDQDGLGAAQAEAVRGRGRRVPVQVLGEVGDGEDQQVHVAGCESGGGERRAPGVDREVGQPHTGGGPVHVVVAVAEDAFHVLRVLGHDVLDRDLLPHRRAERDQAVSHRDLPWVN